MDSINNTKLGGDAWLELQAFKTRQINRREKLNRHKDLINEITTHRNPQLALASTKSIEPNAIGSTSISSRQHTSQAHDNNSRLVGEPNPIYENSTLNDNITCKSTSESNDCISQEASCPTAKETTSTDTNQQQQLAPNRQDSTYIDIDTVECLLLLKLCDVALKLPIDSRSLQRSICRVRGLENASQSLVESLLQKFALQELITIDEHTGAILNGQKRPMSSADEDFVETCIFVTAADHTRLVEFDRSFGANNATRALLLESRSDEFDSEERDPTTGGVGIRSSPFQNGLDPDDRSKPARLVPGGQTDDARGLGGSGNESRHRKIGDGVRSNSKGDDVESLLSLSSTRERESKKLGEELLELLSKPTAKERNLLESFRSADGYQVQEFCPKGTKDECRRNNKGSDACDKLHFRKIIAKHTEESLGDCSFLNTCFHMDSCKYVHYEVDYDGQRPSKNKDQARSSKASNAQRSSNERSNIESCDKHIMTKSDLDKALSKPETSTRLGLSAEEQARVDIRNRKRFKTILYPPQWIQCDLRYFDMSLLGKFSVVMADPPWDIHMELPYGTMSDDEMRKLNVPALQDEGVIFLWVTGRAMELGRECLALWGYDRCDEIIWVKTNQLQRIIRTGRTGHWLNHGKEHCLVGVKGNPTDINRGLDCDIIVAEVRATSHKPDEIYGIIERLSPGTRKIELFGRAHNVQPNWITLGNQLNGVRLVEPPLIEAFKKLDLPFDSA